MIAGSLRLGVANVDAECCTFRVGCFPILSIRIAWLQNEGKAPAEVRRAINNLVNELDSPERMDGQLVRSNFTFMVLIKDPPIDAISILCI
jgi:hypothetical protein